MMIEKNTMNYPKKLSDSSRVRTIITIILTIALFTAIAVYIKDDWAQVKAFIKHFGPAGWMISIPIYGILGVTFIPSEPVTILNSALFGPLAATIAATAGNTIAAYVEYYMGTKVSDLASFKHKKESLPWGLGKLPVQSPLLLIFGRFIPGFGSKAVSLMAGMYKVSPWRYLWTTLVTTAFGSIIFAFGGMGLLHLF